MVNGAVNGLGTMASQAFAGIALGILLGGLGFWLVMRGRLQSLRDKARGEVIAERAAMLERLEAQTRQIQELKTALDQNQADLRRACHQQSTAEAQLGPLAQQVQQLERQLQQGDLHCQQLQQDNAQLQASQASLTAKLEESQRATAEKLALINQAQVQFADTFKALSAEALHHNNQSFMALAQGQLSQFQERAQGDLQSRQRAIDELVKPLANSLEQVDGKLQALEQSRLSAYASLTEQLKSLAATQSQLHSETTNLTRALRAPTVRGRWGEIQLKRVVEIAGMVEHCDFLQQTSVETQQGKLRPDMVIQLPNGKNIIVDSKAPLQAYLEALDAPDEAARLACLKRHARHIRTHLTQLGTKAYWEQFQPTPEFAILFLPGETFFSAALEQDPSLIEFGVDRSVILATPTTLIALLKAVAYGWRQERVAENTQLVRELGQELYDRTRTFVSHFVKLRRNLNATVDSFNKTVGSLESRVLVTARKFDELGAVSGGEIAPLEGIDLTPRPLQSAPADELSAPGSP